jgi:hypothetical protein
MKTTNHRRQIQWLPILLIIWNLVDIAIHIAVDMVEPLRIAGNVVGLVVAVIVLLGIAKSYQAFLLGLGAIIVIVLSAIESSLHGYLVPMLIFVGVSVFLLLRIAQQKYPMGIMDSDTTARPLYLRWWVALALTLIGIGIIALVGEPSELEIGPVAQFHNGELVAADYWRDEPMILSAGMGFADIIGIPDVNEDTVREVGGSWYGSVVCTSGEDPAIADFTSVAPVSGVEMFYKGSPDNDDGLPIVFSWPVASETVDLTDFQFTLNNGDVVFANAIGMWPNWELNERNTVVAFGDFGNRGSSSDDDVIFPIRLDIVEDETPLLLIGPDGQEFNAVGLSWQTDKTPYDAGPVLVGAKLNHVGDEARGEGGVRIGQVAGIIPNDEFALYDEGDFRLRILTTGGFSPDGVTGVRPDMYEQFFRIHVNGTDGETVLLEEVGIDYDVAGGTLRVVGLSDLGQAANPDEGIYYDDCYAEDRDNYIDIILVGDEEAARNITFLEIPALEGGYSAFYNPGGPGPEPFEGVRYTAPGPRRS